MGQLAYETYHHNQGHEPWESLSIDLHARWEEAAAAVYVDAFEKLPEISQASVKVMRSYDYCHFEVQLSTDYGAKVTVRQADELRKEAARLADKAVAQYKIAKANSERLQSERYSQELEIAACKAIEAIAEPIRTVAQQARLKAFQDRVWAASRAYDYEDQWNED